MRSLRILVIACSLPLLLAACNSSGKKAPTETGSSQPVGGQPLTLSVEPTSFGQAQQKLDKKLWLQVRNHRLSQSRVTAGEFNCLKAFKTTTNVNEAIEQGLIDTLSKYYKEVEVLPAEVNVHTRKAVLQEEVMRFNVAIMYMTATVKPANLLSSTDDLSVSAQINGDVEYFFEDGTKEGWKYYGASREKSQALNGSEKLGFSNASKVAYAKRVCAEVPSQLPFQLQASYDDAMKMFAAKLEKYVVNK